MASPLPNLVFLASLRIKQMPSPRKQPCSAWCKPPSFHTYQVFNNIPPVYSTRLWAWGRKNCLGSSRILTGRELDGAPLAGLASCVRPTALIISVPDPPPMFPAQSSAKAIDSSVALSLPVSPFSRNSKHLATYWAGHGLPKLSYPSLSQRSQCYGCGGMFRWSYVFCSSWSLLISSTHRAH